MAVVVVVMVIRRELLRELFALSGQTPSHDERGEDTEQEEVERRVYTFTVMVAIVICEPSLASRWLAASILAVWDAQMTHGVTDVDVGSARTTVRLRRVFHAETAAHAGSAFKCEVTRVSSPAWVATSLAHRGVGPREDEVVAVAAELR